MRRKTYKNNYLYSTYNVGTRKDHYYPPCKISAIGIKVSDTVYYILLDIYAIVAKHCHNATIT
jgi:hypothetical protein